MLSTFLAHTDGYDDKAPAMSSWMVMPYILDKYHA